MLSLEKKNKHCHRIRKCIKKGYSKKGCLKSLLKIAKMSRHYRYFNADVKIIKPTSNNKCTRANYSIPPPTRYSVFTAKSQFRN